MVSGLKLSNSIDELALLYLATVQALAHGVLTVTDEEVKEAMRLMLLRMKILVEPTGAVPVALLLSKRLDLKDQKVGVILSGGNADPDLLAEVLRS